MKRAFLFMLTALLLVLLATPSFGGGKSSVKPPASNSQKSGSVTKKIRPATAFTLVKKDERVRFTPRPQPVLQTKSMVNKDTLGQVLAGVSKPQGLSDPTSSASRSSENMTVGWLLMGFVVTLAAGVLLGRAFANSAHTTESANSLSLLDHGQDLVMPEPVSLMGLNVWPPPTAVVKAPKAPRRRSKKPASVRHISTGKKPGAVAAEKAPKPESVEVPPIWQEAMLMRAVGDTPVRVDLPDGSTQVPEPPPTLRLVPAVPQSSPEAEPTTVVGSATEVQSDTAPVDDAPAVAEQLPPVAALAAAESSPSTASDASSSIAGLIPDLAAAEEEPLPVPAEAVSQRFVFFGPPPAVPVVSGRSMLGAQAASLQWPPSEEDLDTVDVVDLQPFRTPAEDPAKLHTAPVL